MKRNIITSIWNRLNRNGINSNFEYLFELRGLIEKVVIEDSLTPTEYAELTTLISGLLKSGEVKQDDLADDLKTFLNDLETNSESILQEIEGFNTQLADKAGWDELAKVDKKTNERAGISTIPANYRWKTYQILVKKNTLGSFENVKKIENLMPVKQGVTYYVNVNTGTDLNDGLSASTPYKSFSKAIQQADAGEILVAPGIYDRNRGWIKYNPPMSSLIVKPMYPGEIIFGTHQNDLSWTTHNANVYKATRSATQNIMDANHFDKFGDHLDLVKVASISEVSATPNTWYTDGTTVYVRLTDDRVPDNSVRVYVIGGNGYVGGNKKVYIEGIKFFGGDNAFEGLATSTTDKQEIYFKDCEFKYAFRSGDNAANGLTIKGTQTTVLDNCIASKNQRDGFNYHVYNRIIPNAIEVDCTAYENGVKDANNNNNGSTMHDAGNIIRVNGTYFSNKGPNVIDVGGSHSWNVGCAAYSSLSSSNSSSINFLNQDGKMWLDSCVSYNSNFDLMDVGVAETFTKRTFASDELIETTAY